MNFESWLFSVNHNFVERGSGKPIAGAQAILVKSTGGFGSNNVEAIRICKSAIDGYYKFEFEAASRTGYGVEAMDSRYDPWTYPYIALQPSLNNHKNITLYPPAWLKITLLNPSRYYVDFSFGFASSDSTKVFYPTVVGNGIVKFSHTVTNSSTGKKVTYPDSIYCKGFDTTSYTINVPK